MFTVNELPVVATMCPIFFAVIIIIFGRKKRECDPTYVIAFITLVLVLSMYPSIRQGKVLQKVIVTGLKFNFVFRVDSLSFFVGMISTALWLLVSLYGVEYLKGTYAHTRYNVFSLLSLGGMLGVLFTGNLFSLYVFFELLSVASAILVFHEETSEAIRAGFKYLFLSITGGLILLFSVIATYHITGHGDLSLIGIGLKESPWLPYIFWGYIIGFGVKAGMFPMHVWLPSAYPVAPAPASALLSGVMINAGAYGIFRTVYNIIGIKDIISSHINMTLILLILALITIFLGSAIAITQKEIKTMLAYSSISQIGYVIMGIALLSSKAVTGALMHIFAQALMKGALFLCAGAFIHQTGLRKIKDLRGIGRRMPITTAVFSIAALSMIGLPPLVGFVSKWYLALGTLEAMDVFGYWSGWGVIALVMLLLSSFLNLIYYGPIIVGAWFSPEPGKAYTDNRNDDPNFLMLIPLLILGGGVIYFGIFPGLPLNFAKNVSGTFF